MLVFSPPLSIITVYSLLSNELQNDNKEFYRMILSVTFKYDWIRNTHTPREIITVQMKYVKRKRKLPRGNVSSAYYRVPSKKKKQ